MVALRALKTNKPDSARMNQRALAGLHRWKTELDRLIYSLETIGREGQDEHAVPMFALRRWKTSKTDSTRVNQPVLAGLHCRKMELDRLIYSLETIGREGHR
jgi:hypothetical protein